MLEQISGLSSPAAVISDLITMKGSRIHVVRDDLLTGGTKERALWPWLATVDAEEFIYASPFSGYAQIALAYVAQMMGKTCIIVAEKDPTTGDFHPYSLKAQSFGARLFGARTLIEAEDISRGVALNRAGMVKIPLGFDDQGFRDSMKSALIIEWERIQNILPQKITTLWLPVGSGTLASSFLSFLPKDIQVNCLNVRVLKSGDERVKRIAEDPRVTLLEADVPFHTPSRMIPAFPSNRYYDAKVWELINTFGATGEVWWNVAG